MFRSAACPAGGGCSVQCRLSGGKIFSRLNRGLSSARQFGFPTRRKLQFSESNLLSFSERLLALRGDAWWHENSLTQTHSAGQDFVQCCENWFAAIPESPFQELRPYCLVFKRLLPTMTSSTDGRGQNCPRAWPTGQTHQECVGDTLSLLGFSLGCGKHSCCAFPDLRYDLLLESSLLFFFPAR